MNKRQEYNLKIIQKIFALIMEEPDLRFIQALWALGIIDRDEESTFILDRFYEEPEDTLKKIESRFNKWKITKDYPENLKRL